MWIFWQCNQCEVNARVHTYMCKHKIINNASMIMIMDYCEVQDTNPESHTSNKCTVYHSSPAPCMFHAHTHTHLKFKCINTCTHTPPTHTPIHTPSHPHTPRTHSHPYLKGPQRVRPNIHRKLIRLPNRACRPTRNHWKESKSRVLTVTVNIMPHSLV